MARWRLDTPHYLNVPGTEWEYKENDRATGKVKRMVVAVPLFLDPKDPGDWNYKEDKDNGMIVVTNKLDSNFSKDIVFVGDPTPEMVPIDEEALALSQSFQKKWAHPIEDLPGQFSQSLISKFQDQMDEMHSKPVTTVIEGMPEMMATMAAMMKQNQDILAALLADKIPASAGSLERRA